MQELRDLTNALRMHAQVERPTFAQLRGIGMTVVTSTGATVYKRPKTFMPSDPQGYLVTEIARRMNEEKELNDWNYYHGSVPRAGNPRVGANPSPAGLPGPPMTPAERRLAGKEAPKTPTGERICWNYNSHLGCQDDTCPRAHQYYGNYDQLSYALKIALLKRFGFKKRNKLSAEQVGQQIAALRLAEKQEAERNRAQPGSHGDYRPNADPARRVGRANNAPACLANLDYTDLEDELRCAVHGPSAEFGAIPLKTNTKGV